jgi:hypothetical protein
VDRFATRGSSRDLDGHNWDIALKARDGRDEAIQSLHSDEQDIRFQIGNEV